MNKYEKKATLIVGCRTLLAILYIILIFQFTLIVVSLTAAVAFLFAVTKYIIMCWDMEVYKSKQQDNGK